MAVKWTGKKIFATYGPYQGMTFEVLSEPYPAYGYMVLSPAALSGDRKYR